MDTDSTLLRTELEEQDHEELYKQLLMQVGETRVHSDDMISVIMRLSAFFNMWFKINIFRHWEHQWATTHPLKLSGHSQAGFISLITFKWWTRCCVRFYYWFKLLIKDCVCFRNVCEDSISIRQAESFREHLPISRHSTSTSHFPGGTGEAFRLWESDGL